MKLKIVRSLWLVCAALFCNCSASAQTFFKNYEKYLETKDSRENISAMKKHQIAHKFTSELRTVIQRVKNDRAISILSTDTIFMLRETNAMSGKYSTLIWNRKSSCFYEGTFSIEHIKTTVHSQSIETNASKRLSKINQELRKVVESIDTAKFGDYFKSSEFQGNTIVNFTVAIRRKATWGFITSKSYAKSIGE
jgi:cellobiose-specific phosphotransferase system component IIB